ncbi:hypothetical protein YC2023_008201 [Brassica napus]
MTVEGVVSEKVKSQKWARTGKEESHKGQSLDHLESISVREELKGSEGAAVDPPTTSGAEPGKRRPGISGSNGGGGFSDLKSYQKGGKNQVDEIEQGKQKKLKKLCCHILESSNTYLSMRQLKFSLGVPQCWLVLEFLRNTLSFQSSHDFALRWEESLLRGRLILLRTWLRVSEPNKTLGPLTHNLRQPILTMSGFYFVPIGVVVAIAFTKFSSTEVAGASAMTVFFETIGLVGDSLSIFDPSACDTCSGEDMLCVLVEGVNTGGRTGPKRETR